MTLRRAGTAPLLTFVAATACAVAATAVLATVDPNEPGHYPTCPFLAATGLYCPGCGSLRATHALLHGHVLDALQRNPLAVVLLPVVLVLWIAWGMRTLGRRAPHPTVIPAWMIWGLLGVVLAFWVLRNVPGWTVLSPA